MSDAVRLVVPASVFTALVAVLFLFDFLIFFLVLLLSVYIFFYSGVLKLKNKYASVEVGPEKEGEGRVRRNPNTEKELVAKPFDDVSTLYECFQHGLKVAKDKPCFGTRKINSDGSAGEFVWQTFAEVHERILNFGSGLLHIGLAPQARIGIYSENRAEWQITAEACHAYSLIAVSIYDTLGEDNRIFIVKQAELQQIVTKRQHLANVLSLASHCGEHLKSIVIYEEVTSEEEKKAEAVGLKIFSFSQIEKLGASNRRAVIPPKPDDLATIMYTSGTTSTPKGVLITHGNVIATAAGIIRCVLPITSDDYYLSYLPLAHILERVAEAVMMVNGCRIGFWQGNIRKLDEDIKALKPTVFCAVPKVFQRVMNGVHAKVHAGGLGKRIIFSLAYNIKRISLETGLPIGPLDKIFDPVREALGGRVKQMLAGGAPFSGECHEFIRVCFSPCAVVQGYGLTETCGGATVTPVDMPEPYRRAGSPLWCTEVKLVDAGNYSTLNDPPQGEICVSGPNVAIGYYKMDEVSKDVFRKVDGKLWFHTGDVGQWNSDGTLSIVGRTKDIFKLDGGEYVAPERLETIYMQCPLVSNIFVYGESTRAFLVAVVVPDQGAALAWAKANNVDVPDKDSTQGVDCPVSLCKNQKFKEKLLAGLRDVSNVAKLNRFEQIVAVHISPTVWLPQSGLITDALKNKRPVLSKHFAKELAALYEEAEQSQGSSS